MTWLVPAEVFPLEVRSARQSVTGASGFVLTAFIAQGFELTVFIHYDLYGRDHLSNKSH